MLEINEVGPCGPYSTMVHVVIAFFAGLNTCMITFLTLRAKRKNREDRDGNGSAVPDKGPH